MRDTRENILNVSFELFLQKSFKEVTMKEIVEKAGMSKGAFYHYFDSKEQIFLEIINSKFSSLINIDYNSFKTGSFFDFYHEYLKYLDRSYESLKNVFDRDCSFDFNYYSLIFDAIRLFSNFKEKMMASSQEELKSWEIVIHSARESGEIVSSMSDEQIANMFIQTSNGIGMNNMMIGQSENTTISLLALWDSFYALIKA